MKTFELLWSKKRIRRNGRLINCLVLIALVTMPLVVALIFSESMMNGITNRFINIADGHAQVRSSTYCNLPNENIYSVDNIISGYALLYGKSETEQVMLKAVDKSFFNDRRLKNIKIYFDLSTSFDLPNTIIISKSTAEKLGVNINDKIAMIVVPDTNEGVLRPVMLKVIGFYSTNYNQLDSSMAFIPYNFGASLFSSDYSKVVEILFKDPNKLTPIQTDGYITYWQQQNSSLYLNFINSRQMIFLILLIIVFIASFFTASVANQVVEDDMREIAISKLLGASDFSIRFSTFTSIYTITGLGILTGLISGLLIGCNISSFLSFLAKKNILTLSYYLLEFETLIPWNSIIRIIVSMFFVSALSVLLSLRKTKKITPLRLFNGL